MLLAPFAWPDVFSSVAARNILAPAKTATLAPCWIFCCVLRCCSAVVPLLVLAVVRAHVTLAVTLVAVSPSVTLLLATAVALLARSGVAEP